METIFIKALYKGPFTISETLKRKLKELSEKIGLVSTVQFSELLPGIKKELEGLGKQVSVSGDGAILGCNAINADRISDSVDCFVYVGDGKFHPLQMALQLREKKRIYMLNPKSQNITELNWKEVEDFKKRREIIKAMAMSADKIGLLISTKPGQLNLANALKFKEKFEQEQGKKAYLFLMDNFDENQIENWPKLTYVNTACPGLALDKKFANIRDF
jgi:2-(3-amino-3-carboxypropyl)histidine synthase